MTLRALAATLAAAACFAAIGAPLTPAQIKQIEEIAQEIARRHNAASKDALDDMTVSTSAVAIGRTVRFEYVLRVRRGLPQSKLSELSEELKREIVPATCRANISNAAFDRGLAYTFTYRSLAGEKLSEFTVDKQVCAK